MLFQFIIKILFRKDVESMAVIYATLIIKGKKTFADVPEKIKDKVKEVLIDLDCPELAELSTDKEIITGTKTTAI